MKKKKKFDCVQMKNEIQRRILKEREEFSEQEQRRRARERISADPVLGPFWERAIGGKERESGS
jgi:hypothetical protein